MNGTHVRPAVNRQCAIDKYVICWDLEPKSYFREMAGIGPAFVARVERTGCSAHDETLAVVISGNRAGIDDTEMSLDEIVDSYCLKANNGVAGVRPRVRRRRRRPKLQRGGAGKPPETTVPEQSNDSFGIDSAGEYYTRKANGDTEAW